MSLPLCRDHFWQLRFSGSRFYFPIRLAAQTSVETARVASVGRSLPDVPGGAVPGAEQITAAAQARISKMYSGHQQEQNVSRRDRTNEG